MTSTTTPVLTSASTATRDHMRRWRLLRRARAVIGGTFWRPCPRCATPFAGHEISTATISVPTPSPSPERSWYVVDGAVCPGCHLDLIHIGFTCPECGMTSHNPNDISNGYCGNCYAYTGADRGTVAVTLYFGELWDVPALDNAEHVEYSALPPNVHCYHCGEPITLGDRGYLRPAILADGQPDTLAIHRECDLAQVVGNLDHVEGRCQHVGHCNDLFRASGRTRREDALAVWERVQQHGLPH